MYKTLFFFSLFMLHAIHASNPVNDPHHYEWMAKYQVLDNLLARQKSAYDILTKDVTVLPVSVNLPLVYSNYLQRHYEILRLQDRLILLARACSAGVYRTLCNQIHPQMQEVDQRQLPQFRNEDATTVDSNTWDESSLVSTLTQSSVAETESVVSVFDREPMAIITTTHSVEPCIISPKKGRHHATLLPKITTTIQDIEKQKLQKLQNLQQRTQQSLADKAQQALRWQHDQQELFIQSMHKKIQKDAQRFSSWKHEEKRREKAMITEKYKAIDALQQSFDQAQIISCDTMSAGNYKQIKPIQKSMQQLLKTGNFDAQALQSILVDNLKKSGICHEQSERLSSILFEYTRRVSADNMDECVQMYPDFDGQAIFDSLVVPTCDERFDTCLRKFTAKYNLQLKEQQRIYVVEMSKQLLLSMFALRYQNRLL